MKRHTNIRLTALHRQPKKTPSCVWILWLHAAAVICKESDTDILLILFGAKSNLCVGQGLEMSVRIFALSFEVDLLSCLLHRRPPEKKDDFLSITAQPKHNQIKNSH